MDSDELVNIGGNRNVVLNAEFITPFPGAGNDRTLRLFGFMDVGNVYGPGEKLSASDLRASVGVGLSWISPIGPCASLMRALFASKPQDKIQKFQFQIGTSF
jgi:outer membrane protein insertion porin family